MKRYDLCLRGKTYNGISLTEVRQLLSKVYSYAYVDELVTTANADSPSLEIDWEPGQRRKWVIDGVPMSAKTARFYCEWKGCNKEESECLLRANKLCAETEETIRSIRETCKRIDEVLGCWSNKS